MARMTLGDFDAELVARGFGALSPDQRYRYINWGYRYIARKFTWFWEKTTLAISLVVGDYLIDAADGTSTEITNFRSISKVFITTAAYRNKLRVLTDEQFFRDWLPRDLTSPSNQGIPTNYYLYDQQLYILPPPSTPIDLVIHYTRRVTDLVQPGDSPITPPHLDEPIVMSAIKRAHMRTMELGLAQVAQAEVDEAIGDMEMDEVFDMEDQFERVLPDDTWL